MADLKKLLRILDEAVDDEDVNDPYYDKVEPELRKIIEPEVKRLAGLTYNKFTELMKQNGFSPEQIKEFARNEASNIRDDMHDAPDEYIGDPTSIIFYLAFKR